MFYIWQSVRDFFGRLRLSRLVLHLDEEILAALQKFARRNGKSTREYAVDILTGSVIQIAQVDDNQRRWESLTPRQQQVAALVCLGYTNPQIAAKLHLSLPTVKTHVQNVFQKFGVSRRIELATLLADWDFRDW